MQNLFIKELGIKYLSECLNRYNGNTGFVLLYLCLVIFIVYKWFSIKKQSSKCDSNADIIDNSLDNANNEFNICKSNNDEYKQLRMELLTFVPLTIIMVITVFNPVFPVILAKFTDVSNEYYRFFWIVPVIILIPYMFTKLASKVFRLDDRALNEGDNADKGESIDNISEKKDLSKNLIVLFIIAVLFASSIVYIREFKIAENIYKVPDELIDVVEIIHNDSEYEYAKAYFDYEYNMMVRQYDPKMLLTIDRENYIFAATNDYSTDEIYDNEHPEYRILAALFRYQPVDNDTLKEGFDLTGTEYIVLQNGSTNIQRLLSIGLTEVAVTESHTILKYSLLERKPFELVDYSEVYENGW